MFQATERVRSIEYAIRDVVAFAKGLEKRGREVFYLNIGDPVKFGFETPRHIRQALIAAVEEGSNWYSASEGLPELREAICEKERRTGNVGIAAEDVIVTNGISEAILMVMAALVEAGDEVLLPGPTYPPYISYAKFFGGRPVTYRTVEEEGWQPDISDLRSKITPKTRAIFIINPNNPTGALYSSRILREIVDAAAEHSVPIVSDEIYDQLIYEGGFIGTSAVAGEVPVVGLNGFSKAYLMTGWRLGYLYFYDPRGELYEFREDVKKEARIRICPNTPVQRAGIDAIRGPQNHIGDMVGKLRRRRNYALKRLEEVEGLDSTRPQGAFYIFPKVEGVSSRWRSDREFVLELLNATGVLLVHGSGFDSTHGSGHFRLVFLPPEEVLEAAFDRMERFIYRST